MYDTLRLHMTRFTLEGGEIGRIHWASGVKRLWIVATVCWVVFLLARILLFGDLTVLQRYDSLAKISAFAGLGILVIVGPPLVIAAALWVAAWIYRGFRTPKPDRE